MRIIVLVMFVVASTAGMAQTSWSPGFMDYMQRPGFGNTLHALPGVSEKKWFVSSYSGVSTSFIYFNRTSASLVGIPLGLQLNRRLTNNLYAFAGISVTPAYINFNHSFLSTDINKAYPGNGLYRTNNFGMFSRAEMGLQYVNDARTFSVSGSIGVERINYQMVPYPQVNQTKQNQGVPLSRAHN